MRCEKAAGDASPQSAQRGGMACVDQPALHSGLFAPLLFTPLLFTRENLMNSEQFITFPAESEARVCSYVPGSVLWLVLR